MTTQDMIYEDSTLVILRLATTASDTVAQLSQQPHLLLSLESLKGCSRIQVRHTHVMH
jgi:hypothetical protein